MPLRHRCKLITRNGIDASCFHFSRSNTKRLPVFYSHDNVNRAEKIGSRNHDQSDRKSFTMHSLGERLLEARRLIVRQRADWGETFLQLETTNRYDVVDDDGESVVLVAEQAPNLSRYLALMFMGPARPLTLVAYDHDGTPLAVGEKPHRWVFWEMRVSEGERHIGRIVKRFAVLRRRLTVYDESDEEVLEITGSLFRPWTFKVKCAGQEIARIRKKWSGILRESFSSADDFGLEMVGDWEPHPDFLVLLLFATLHVDYCYFERKR